MNMKEHPELVNYMGFTQQVDLDSETRQVGEALYDEHLTFDEMVLGIREGKLFKGRLNVSRVNIEEATVTVEGLNDELLVLGARNLNRALNGDIVCLQVLPERDWIANFKESEMKSAIDKDVIDDESKSEEEDNEVPQSKEKISLMQKINGEKLRRVTAIVRGVIKPMNKTYGGSILQAREQSQQTREKFEFFLKNLRVPKEEAGLYRVFVPYNIQLP